MTNPHIPLNSMVSVSMRFGEVITLAVGTLAGQGFAVRCERHIGYDGSKPPTNDCRTCNQLYYRAWGVADAS